MRFGLLAAGAAALMLQGCGQNGTAPESRDRALVSFASASPDAGALDLLVHGKTIARGVGSTKASQPAEVEAGSTTGEVRSTSTTDVLARVPLTLEAGKGYTVLVAGPRDALTTTVAVDSGPGEPPPPLPPVEPPDSGPPPPPSEDYARFRIVHAAPHAPPLDPYLQPAGAPLDTVPLFQPFEYGSLALIADAIRPAGEYTVAFARAGTREVVLSSQEISASIGDLLIVVLGENADRSLRVDVARE